MQICCEGDLSRRNRNRGGLYHFGSTQMSPRLRNEPLLMLRRGIIQRPTFPPPKALRSEADGFTGVYLASSFIPIGTKDVGQQSREEFPQ